VITEDLGAYLVDFGEEAMFDGGLDAVRVIFNAPHASLPDAGMGMADNRPSLLMRSADVPCEASEDDADIEVCLLQAETLRPGFPTHYRVTEVQPDATGFSTLVLRAA
jgi:hypothetical protein